MPSTRDQPDDQAAAACAALMARYCDGEARAFHELYTLLAPRILGYLASLSRDHAAAEDLLQLTFLKLHQARGVYVRGANPIPWIYTIAHRTCLDELRRRRRSRVRLAADELKLPELPVDLTGAPQEAAETAPPAADSEAVGRAMAALATLPESQRHALLLTKVHGRSHAEAASIAGTTVGAIKLRAHRGYVTLRRLLGNRAQLEERS